MTFRLAMVKLFVFICALITPCFLETVLIPRKEILSTNDYSSVQLSHDGKWIAYIGPSFEQMLNGAKNVYIKDLPDGTPKRLTHEHKDSIASLYIAYDGKTILYLSDPDGDENFSLNMINIETGKDTVIEDDMEVRAYPMSSSPSRTNELIIGINKRNPIFHDAFLLNLETGTKTMIFENNYYVQVLFNYQLEPVLGYNETDDAGVTFYHLLPNGQAELIKKSPPQSTDTTKPQHVDITGTVYWFDNDQSDKVAFVAMDMKTKQSQVLYTGKRADVYDATYHPATGRPLWLSEEYMKTERVPLDSSFNSDFECFRKNLPQGSTIDVTDMSLDMKRWLVSVSFDNKYPAYYLYDRPQRRLQYLFSMKRSLLNYQIGSTYPFEVPVSDKLTEICYVTLPVDFDVNKNGIPSKPLSTIVFVHGGPTARDSWEFSLYPQYLANRNYAIIRCNYRGSTGFGKAFVNAAVGEWGLKMQQDVTDAVHWAIEKKISDPSKIAIAGYSFGGYSTLAGLAFTPDLYACGVDIVGPSNLISLLNTIPEYWKAAYKSLANKMGGSPNTVEGMEKLRKSSPLFAANNIKKPLLIGQGANDPRVKQAEADQIFEALKSSNIPVTYVLFSNEGHGFTHPENDIAFWALAEKFLGDCLGGKVEPLTDEIEKSTAKVQSHNVQNVQQN